MLKTQGNEYVMIGAVPLPSCCDANKHWHWPELDQARAAPDWIGFNFSTVNATT
jgi:hypothetical protein